MREALVALLEERGHAARVVPHGALALEAISASTPDVLRVDIGMPGVSGLELGRRLKTKPAMQQIRGVQITAFGEEPRRAALKAVV